MVVSARAKAVIALAVLVGLAGYAVIVELGITAGRIHPGVAVAGVDIGGKTEAEAAGILAGRAGEFRNEPIVFEAQGLTLEFTPAEIGWAPEVRDTIKRAEAVGRSGGPIPALLERGRAWLFGITLPFAGKPRPHLMNVMLDDWERIARAAGVSIDRSKLRFKVRRAVRNRPGGPYRIPLAGT